MTATTVGEELKHNPRLTKSKEEFVQIMESLGLTRPAKMGNVDYMHLLNFVVIAMKAIFLCRMFGIECRPGA